MIDWNDNDEVVAHLLKLRNKWLPEPQKPQLPYHIKRLDDMDDFKYLRRDESGSVFDYKEMEITVSEYVLRSEPLDWIKAGAERMFQMNEEGKE